MRRPNAKPDPAQQPLTEQEAEFVRHYLADPLHSATAAAKAAGYKASNARVLGPRLLKQPRIQRAIAGVEGAAEFRANVRLAVTLDAVIDELAKIAFSNILDYVRITSEGDPYIDLSKITRDQGAAIVETTVEDYTEGRGEDARNVRRVKIKLADKKSALIDLGRHLGGFRPPAQAKPGEGDNAALSMLEAFFTLVRDTRSRSAIPIAEQPAPRRQQQVIE